MKNSKTEEKTKSFDTVQTFREIKNKISEETFGMNFDDFKKYLNKKVTNFKKNKRHFLLTASHCSTLKPQQ